MPAKYNSLRIIVDEIVQRAIELERDNALPPEVTQHPCGALWKPSMAVYYSGIIQRLDKALQTALAKRYAVMGRRNGRVPV